MKKVRLLALLALIAGAVVVLPSAAPATPYPFTPRITFPEHAGGYSTTNMTIVGRGVPGGTVRLVLGDPPCPTGSCFDNPTLATTTVDPFGDWSVPVLLTEGQHLLYMFWNNGTGEVYAHLVEFLVDATPPAAPTITYPLGGETFTHKLVQLEGTAEPRARVVVVDQNGGIRSATTASDGTWRMPSYFANGPHTLTAYQQDLAFNNSPSTGPLSFTIDVDVTPPAAPVILTPTEGSMKPATVVVGGIAEPGSSVEILEDEPEGFIIYDTVVADGAGNWSTTLTFLNHFHHIQARAIDAAGNMGPRSPRRTFLVDAIAPSAKVFKPSMFLLAAPYFDGDDVIGDASDNFGVASIEVTYEDLLGGTVVTNVAVCSACPEPYVRWTDTPAGLAPGLTFVSAVAIDQVGNRSKPGETILLVSGL